MKKLLPILALSVLFSCGTPVPDATTTATPVASTPAPATTKAGFTPYPPEARELFVCHPSFKEACECIYSETAKRIPYEEFEASAKTKGMQMWDSYPFTNIMRDCDPRNK